MATKKEVFNSAMEILNKYDVEEGLVKELTELLEPGKGGQRVNLEEITRKDEGGNVTHIKCRYSGAWLPANSEYFPKDNNSKVIGTDGVPLYTVSKLALKARQEAQKAYTASKEAITNDLLDGAITPEDARAALAELSKEPDYSAIQDVE